MAHLGRRTTRIRTKGTRGSNLAIEHHIKYLMRDKPTLDTLASPVRTIVKDGIQVDKPTPTAKIRAIAKAIRERQKEK